MSDHEEDLPRNPLVPFVETGSIQLELFKATDITRPDINIGKWAGWIFSSPWSNDLFEAKTLEFKTGDRNSSIHIHPLLDNKRPTITTYRIFLALNQMWEQSGKPRDGRIKFSVRSLIALVGWKPSGWAVKQIKEHLIILSGTQITWKSSYKTPDGNTELFIEDMHLIDAKSYLNRNELSGSDLSSAVQTVRLNYDLVQNMLAGNTKPVNYKAFLSIKTDASATLYNYLDIYLSKKYVWERRALGLFSEIGLTGQRYKNRSIRKQMLEKLKLELNGKELSSGKLSISIKETSDKKDYKLVVKKIAVNNKNKNNLIPIGNPKNDKEDIPLIVDDIFEQLSHLGNVSETSRKTLETLARYYDRHLLLDTASIVKVDFRGKVKKSPVAAYINALHMEVHKRNLKWYNPSKCGNDCKWRTENLIKY